MSHSLFSSSSSPHPTDKFLPDEWRKLASGLERNAITVWQRVYLGRETEVYQQFPFVNAHTVTQGEDVVSMDTLHLLPPGMSNELRYVTVSWSKDTGFSAPVCRSVPQDCAEGSSVLTHFALELCKKTGEVACYGYMFIYSAERTQYFRYSSELGVSIPMDNGT